MKHPFVSSANFFFLCMTRFLYTLLLAILPLVGVLQTPAQSRDYTAQQSSDTYSKAIRERLDNLLASELFQRSQVGVYVYDLTDDKPVYQNGYQQVMRPASTMKVLTGVLALDRLGTDYKLTTGLYVTAPIADTLRGNVVVKGGFDPLFSVDDLRALVGALRRNGIVYIAGDVHFDLSFKSDDPYGWGWCWDDNDTPLTPLYLQGKDTFESAFETMLLESGIGVSGQFRAAQLPSSAQLLATRSHSIDQVLIPMMKKSDNHFAESLYYQIAALSRKPFASRKEAEVEFQSFVSRLGLNPNHYQFADGSGLSLYNYITPELLVQTLRYAYYNQEIYTHLLATLPVMGRDGTLHKRGRNTTAQDKVQAKTGTLEGVSSLAGYALAANGHQLCFAIINQGLLKASTARQFQDRVCRALTAGLSRPRESEPDAPANLATNDEPLEGENEEVEIGD